VAVDADAVLTGLERRANVAEDRVDIGSVVVQAERGQTAAAGESGEKGKIRCGNIESRIMVYRLENIYCGIL
jgi:hypothetical protein